MLAVPFGISMGNSGKFVLDVYWKNLLLAFLIIATCRTARDLYAYAWSYVAGALILSYLALFFFDLQRYGTDFSYARLAGLATWDANDVVLVLMPALACALLVFQVARPQGKVLALLALSASARTIARSGSRGGLIGLVAVAVALLFFGRGVSFGQACGDHLRRGARAEPGGADGLLAADAEHPESQGGLQLHVQGWTEGGGQARHWLHDGASYLRARHRQLRESGVPHIGKGTQHAGGIWHPVHATSQLVRAGRRRAGYSGPGALGLDPPVWHRLAVALGRRLPYRWRRGTREERFLRLAFPYMAVALVGFTATCFFLNFAWLEPYYVLGAFVAATMGVMARRMREQRAEIHAAALAGNTLRQEAAAIVEPVPLLPGQARYPRPLVMLPTARLRPGDLSSW